MSNTIMSVMDSAQPSDEAEDVKPQLLYTKFQRLKNSATKLARVLIIDEMPVPGASPKSAQTLKNNQLTTRDTSITNQTQVSNGD